MPPSIIPERAPVRPRAVSPETGQTLLLEDLVGEVLNHAHRGAIQILGAPGMGKSTALRHLAAVLPQARHAEFLDDAPRGYLPHPSAPPFLVYTASNTADKPAMPMLASIALAHWGTDEFLEYLLARHPQRCGSVLSRLQQDSDTGVLGGVPELWRIVLDCMVEDESLSTAVATLLAQIRRHSGSGRIDRTLYKYCLMKLGCWQPPSWIEYQTLSQQGFAADLVWLLRHRPCYLLIAAHEAAAELNDLEEALCLEQSLGADMIRATGPLLSSAARTRLELMVSGGSGERQAIAMGLLLAGNSAWKPTAKVCYWMRYFDFQGAQWCGVDLSSCDAIGIDLSFADLSQANLTNAFVARGAFCHAYLYEARLELLHAHAADFSGANLSACQGQGAIFLGASLTQAVLRWAVLPAADFREADLTGASLADADLTESKFENAVMKAANLRDAVFESADLTDVKFTDADLKGAKFPKATLRRCDLEGAILNEATFVAADLSHALLTASQAPGVDFSFANLRGSYLAEIEWEGANLRFVDLRDSTFHMGSSRSGLVNSPIACEGSRTGFYTDEFSEQDYKAPEEIRKANLRGANLEGARIDGVDFYLVDLRDANYTKDQEKHFRRCGAILDDRQT